MEWWVTRCIWCGGGRLERVCCDGLPELKGFETERELAALRRMREFESLGYGYLTLDD